MSSRDEEVHGTGPEGSQVQKLLTLWSWGLSLFRQVDGFTHDLK